MSEDMPSLRARASIPEIGRWVPTAALHLSYLTVAVGLSVLVLESPFWRAIGLLLAVAGTVIPSRVPTWWLLLLLCLNQFWREPSPTDVAYYLLLAGVHVLHVLGSLTRLLPWDGRVQLTALTPAVRRFVLVQAVVQPVAVGALNVFVGRPGTVAGLSILAAAVLGVVVAVLARGLWQERARG